MGHPFSLDQHLNSMDGIAVLANFLASKGSIGWKRLVKLVPAKYGGWG